MNPRLLYVLGSAVIGLGACHPSSSSSDAVAAAVPPPAKPVAVQMVGVEPRPMPRFLRVTGQLQAQWDAMVASDAAGKVVATPVERGSVVKEGEVLVKLDERLAQMTLREAAASVSLAKAQADLSGSELERNQPLAATKAIAAADFNRLSADSAAKTAQLAAAEARREQAQKALEDAVISAPFAGTVAERLVSPGEYVRPGQAVARVVNTASLRLVLNVPEVAVGRIQVGQQVAFRVAAYPETEFEGKIQFIGAALREASRDLQVEAMVANADGRLKPGLFAEASLRTGDEQALAVPLAALRLDGTRRKVFIVKEGRLEERLVEVGETAGDWIEIRKGIEPAERVALNPGSEAVDGVAVQSAPQP